MRLRRTDRSRRSAGARLGRGRHRFVIMYIRHVTDAGTVPCRGYWKGGMSRIPGDWRWKRLAVSGIGGSVGGRAQLREATTRTPEHQPGEPASATGLYLEVNVFDTRDRLVTCQRSSALFLAFLLANDGLCLLPGTLARVPPGGHRLPKDGMPVPLCGSRALVYSSVDHRT